MRSASILVLVWLAIAAVAALELWPAHPGSMGGWLVFAILAPPCYLLAQGISEWAWGTRAARFVSQHPSRFVRIALGVVAGVVGTAIVAALWFAIAHTAGGLGSNTSSEEIRRPAPLLAVAHWAPAHGTSPDAIARPR